MRDGHDGDDAEMRAVALAGWRGGKSQRQIAIDLFGTARVDAEWSPDCRMRAKVRRLVWRARTASGGVGQRAEPFTVECERRIHEDGERAGWAYATHGMAWGQICLIDGMVLLSAPKRMGFKTVQSYDTGVSHRDCSGECSFDDVAKWLEGAKVVALDYDRKV